MVLRALGAWVVVLACMVAPDARAEQPDTRGYAALLSASVSGGRVDYARVRKDQASLDAYLAAVESVQPAKLGPDAMAFWVNAYNARVLRQVLAEQDKGGGKLRSVLDVKGFFDALKYPAAGESLTLNELEERKLRKAFNDPRIHFVVNCASASCPVLDAKPYVAADMNARLDAATRAYLATQEGLRVLPTGGVSVSKLFEWYAGDFGGPDGVKAFLLKHAPAAAHPAITKGPISFHEYDWTLNAR